jgi:hypothetical protein
LLDGLRVGSLPQNAWNGRILTNVKVLLSLPESSTREATTISLPRQASSSFLLSATYQLPVAPLCITNSMMQKAALSKPPFRATLRVVFVDLGAVVESQADVELRHFDLVDDMGNLGEVRRPWSQCEVAGFERAERCGVVLLAWPRWAGGAPPESVHHDGWPSVSHTGGSPSSSAKAGGACSHRLTWRDAELSYTATFPRILAGC